MSYKTPSRGDGVRPTTVCDTFCAQVSAASGGIDFDRSVKTLAPGYDFNLSLDPGCTDTDVHGC